MDEQSRDNESAVSTKRSQKRIRTIFILVFASVLCLLCWRIFFFESVDKKLAAIETARTIPDSENAATIYNELMESHTSKELQPDFLKRELDNITLKEQWTSKEHPELARWLQEQQDIMDKLLQASWKDKCQLKINAQPRVTDKLEINRYAVLRGGGCLLIRAGNNDMAEGRIDQALEKYIGVLRIGNHLCQQQKMLDFMVGSSIENLTLRQLNRFVIEGRTSIGIHNEIKNSRDTCSIMAI